MIALENFLPSPFKKLGRSTEWILQLFVRGGKRVRFLAAPSTFESYCPSLLYPPARKKPFSPSSTHSSVAQGSPSPPLSALLLLPLRRGRLFSSSLFLSLSVSNFPFFSLSSPPFPWGGEEKGPSPSISRQHSTETPGTAKRLVLCPSLPPPVP